MSRRLRLTRAVEERSAWIQRQLDAPARDTRSAVVLGRLLGLAFAICFLTGLYSHFLQDPRPWMRFPTWPANLYQLSQGIHITTGISLFPLIVAKLWTVYPRLFVWPPVHSVLELLGRLSIAVLIGAAVVEPVTGLLNTFQWYPWRFPFRSTHYALAWIVVGSTFVHVSAKLPEIVAHWRGGSR